METDGTPETAVADASSADSTRPRALIHKKILGEARANPDASTTQIAAEVSGASVELVEQVLEEYGDPAADNPGENAATDDDASTGDEAATSGDTAEITDSQLNDEDEDEAADDAEPSQTRTTDPETGSEETADEQPVRDPAGLDEKQRETLQAIYEHPTATQAEIAESLGVSRATIPKRLNDVAGFEWASRREFVDRLFESEEPIGDGRGPATSSVTDSLDGLAAQIESLEARLDREASRQEVRIEPELLHKLVHACMDTDYITREEELRVLRQLLPGNAAERS
jgi:hypothetical protein